MSIKESNTQGEWTICCPHCQNDYTHILHAGSLVSIAENKEHFGCYPGTEVIGKTYERRGGIEIIFECEYCRKRFSMIVQQHKGNNFIHFTTDRGINEPYSVFV